MAGWRERLGLAMSPDQFRRALLAELQQRRPEAGAVYRGEDSTIAFADDRLKPLNLTRAYAEYRATPAHNRDEVVAGFADMAFEPLRELTFDGERERLRPVIENHSRLFNGDTRTIAFRPLAGPWAVHVVIHLERFSSAVTTKMLGDWGIDLETALAVALENLRAADSEARFDRHPGGFLVTNYHDLYDSSRVLMPEVIDRLGLKGDPVAIALSRRCLCLAGSGDPEALAAMGRFAFENIRQEPAVISPAPMIRRDGIWEPFAERPGEPEVFQFLRVQQTVWNYQLQEEWLGAEAADRGLDARLSEVRVADWKGKPRTWTAWPANAMTWLAETDLVAVARADGAGLFSSFADVKAACGLTAEPGYVPPRYRADRAGPSAEAIARLTTELAGSDWGPTAAAGKG